MYCLRLSLHNIKSWVFDIYIFLILRNILQKYRKNKYTNNNISNHIIPLILYLTTIIEYPEGC